MNIEFQGKIKKEDKKVYSGPFFNYIGEQFNDNHEIGVEAVNLQKNWGRLTKKIVDCVKTKKIEVLKQAKDELKKLSEFLKIAGEFAPTILAAGTTLGLLVYSFSGSGSDIHFGQGIPNPNEIAGVLGGAGITISSAIGIYQTNYQIEKAKKKKEGD